jgi:hypothetical protein
VRRFERGNPRTNGGPAECSRFGVGEGQDVANCVCAGTAGADGGLRLAHVRTADAAQSISARAAGAADQKAIRDMLATTAAVEFGSECPVSRYYFNLVGPKGVIIDPEGVEVSENDLEQAIPRILEEICSEEPELLDVGGGWSLEVVDVEGRRVAIIPFAICRTAN